MRALVVDDSRAARSILRRTLVEAGFAVEEAADGHEAATRLSDGAPPDVAFVDWNMPVMSGLDLVKWVRERTELDDMVVMMVTSESEPRQLVRALNAGANEYLMKPFTRDALLGKLDLLGLKRRD